jgi:cell division protein FtsB
VEALKADKEAALKDYDSLLTRYKQLRLDMEDQKENEGKLKANVEELKKEVALGQEKYDALRAHAEEKLDRFVDG